MGFNLGDVSSANCSNLERRLFTAGGGPVSSLPNSSIAPQLPTQLFVLRDGQYDTKSRCKIRLNCVKWPDRKVVCFPCS
jgi:hypothetical protein